MFTFPTGLFVPSQSGDPFWANVVFLQNFQGTNGSKPATDQSQYAHVLTWNGDAVISTAQSPFAGGSSAYFDGNGDSVSIASNPFATVSGDLTIEAFCYCAGANTDYYAGQLYSPNSHILFARNGSNVNNFYFQSLWVNSSSRFLAFNDENGGANGSLSTPNNSFPLNTFVHVAFTSVGGVWRLFISGQKLAEATRGNPGVSPTSYYSVGRNPSGTAYSYALNGYLAGLRISRFARYTSNFTPPTAPFPTGP